MAETVQLGLTLFPARGMIAGIFADLSVLATEHGPYTVVMEHPLRFPVIPNVVRYELEGRVGNKRTFYCTRMASYRRAPLGPRVRGATDPQKRIWHNFERLALIHMLTFVSNAVVEAKELNMDLRLHPLLDDIPALMRAVKLNPAAVFAFTGDELQSDEVRLFNMLTERHRYEGLMLPRSPAVEILPRVAWADDGHMALLEAKEWHDRKGAFEISTVYTEDAHGMTGDTPLDILKLPVPGTKIYIQRKPGHLWPNFNAWLPVVPVHAPPYKMWAHGRTMQSSVYEMHEPQWDKRIAVISSVASSKAKNSKLPCAAVFLQPVSPYARSQLKRLVPGIRIMDADKAFGVDASAFFVFADALSQHVPEIVEMLRLKGGVVMLYTS
jgi:hypothetical protein